MSARLRQDDPFGYAPRGLGLDEAARYLGIGRTLFLDLVERRQLPRPKRLGRRTVWDRHRLDAAFDELPEDGARNPLDDALGDS